MPVELLGRAAPRIRGHQAEALLTSTLLLRLLGIEHVGVSIDEQALHRALRATVSSERVACSVPNCLSYVLRLAACLTTPSWLPVIWSRRPAWRSGRCEQRVTYVLPERLPAHHHTSSLSSSIRVFSCPTRPPRAHGDGRVGGPACMGLAAAIQRSSGYRLAS